MASELDVSAVGKEFVRQYYTVLNQRPDCLHQFFTEDSSYVHGGYERPGEEKPASTGQSLIHQKVLSLGFHDCRTKIHQVDCQKTVGNAVLVQVSGELSKSGEAMRRFMQSFVLVRQTPKNFYVHNDIFRYQDEVFVETPPPAPEVLDDVTPESCVVEAFPVEEESLQQPIEESAPEAPLSDAAPTAMQTRQEEVEEVEETVSEHEHLQQQQQQSPKGFSWASMASRNVSVPPKPQAAVKPERKAEQVKAPPPVQAPPRTSVPSTGEETAPSIADNQQLFIGNLPHNIAENEIKELFGDYGTVINVKVIRKGNNRDVPNFGFVAFDCHEAVVRALESKPIFLHGKRRINIEEKKDQAFYRASLPARNTFRLRKEE